jgi:hypothetical protein
VAAAEDDAAQPAESPATAHISAAATIHPLLLFDGNRRTLGRRACSAMVTEAGYVPWRLDDLPSGWHGAKDMV